MNMREFELNEVYPNPDQPRKVFKQSELMELAESIKEHGQLQPGRVRPDGQGRYMIVMGERRFRACQLAGVKYKAIVDDELSDDDLIDQAIIENLQRVNISPMEEARAFQKRIETGLTVQELAKRLGIRRPTFIESRLELLKLNPIYQQALEEGVITVGQANQMARLSYSGQDVLMNLIKSGKVKSYKQCVNVADEILAAESQTDFFGQVTLSKTEKKVVSVFERLITKIVTFLENSFKEGDIVILRKINPDKTRFFAEQVKLILKHLKQLEMALEKSIAKDIIFDGKC